MLPAYLRRLAIPLLAACLLMLAQPMPPMPARPPAEAAAGEISFWIFGDAEEQRVYQTLVEAYARANPAVTVRLAATPGQGDFMSKLSAAFAAGTPPDVFLINYRRVGQLLNKGLIEPAEDWLERDGSLRKDDYYEQAVRAFSQGGRLQCVPQNQSSLVVYYNRDAFQTYGVPLPQPGWTWADFLQAARSLTRDLDGDGRVDLYGLGVEPSIVRASAFIWQHGGRILDDDQHPTALAFDDPKTREALRFFVELSTVERVVPGQAEYRAEDLDSQFMAGKLAMTLNSRRVVPEYRQIRAFTWDVAALPRDVEAATPLHSDAYCLSAASGNKAAAWDFVRWANGVEGQRIAASLGRTVPSLKAVATSPAFLDPEQAPASSQVFLDVMPGIRPLPIVPEWPAIESVLNAEIERAFFGGSLDEAIETAQQKVAAILKR